jgi:hypothetical protein
MMQTNALIDSKGWFADPRRIFLPDIFLQVVAETCRANLSRVSLLCFSMVGFKTP